MSSKVETSHNSACEVCGAQVATLRRGRCWICYVRWADARPVGLGAKCAICSDRRRENLRMVEERKHSRYPVCEGSLDKIVGVVHIKDLIGLSADTKFDLSTVIRPPQYVPETMPVRRLLRQFQSTHQHLAFLVDEYGTVSGIVTLENILEAIIGPVEDEFDDEQPERSTIRSRQGHKPGYAD